MFHILKKMWNNKIQLPRLHQHYNQILPNNNRLKIQYTKRTSIKYLDSA